MNPSSISLDSLGLSSGTDKSSWGHDYLRFYEDYFKKLRYQPIKLLEIGLAGGASLRVWDSYFCQGVIVGADIDPSAMAFARERVLIELVDQSDMDQLVKLGIKHGPFDIIIEDGSHMWEHQIITLKTLFPFVKDDGIYVVEDLQTNYGEMQNNFRGASRLSCVDYLKQLVDVRVADAQLDISKLEDPFIKTYGRRIRSINFYKECCLIQNGSAPTPEQPLVPDERDVGATLLRLVAHIGSYGDRHCDSNTIHGRANQNIQGFTIYSNGIPENELEYRARYKDGTWTDWAHVGQFVGTRGRSEDLSGLSVRITGKCEREYHILVAGKFDGIENTVVTGNGEECIAGSPSTKLRAFQIVLLKMTK